MATRRTAMDNEIITGDVRETLPELPESSVHMCMMSPPYWQLRDYGDGTVTVWGGDEDCDHEWTAAGEVRRGGSNTQENPPDVGGNQHAQDTGIRGSGVESDECRCCGAWRGQLGLEPVREQYVENLVAVFRHIRRVLRPDGSAWLNLGDTYKNKQKNLIPHRVAIALQSDGWVVRNDATWLKPNPMPSSVKDRLNTTTEQIFHLTPQPDYWYDLDAIREPHQTDDPRVADHDADKAGQERSFADTHPAGKNPGDVFEVTTKPFPGAHFAVYPPKLCEKPIKASCPPKVCVDCGPPYDRETVDNETVPMPNTDREQGGRALERFEESGLSYQHLRAMRAVGFTDAGQAQEVYDGHGKNEKAVERLASEAKDVLGGYAREFLGDNAAETEWCQSCDCDTDDTEPGIVLDAFAGAGTTLLKAKELGRRFVGIELNPEYADMARSRVGLDVDDPSRIRDDDAQQGFEAYQ
jgi:DNA modification methylase